MAIKYFGPNDKRGVFWPHYTAAKKRQMDAIDCRKPHSGPYIVVYPTPAARGLACLVEPLVLQRLPPVAFAAFPTP